MGTEWRRISGSTSGEGCADAPPGAEADGGSFSARRPTAVFDSWRKYAPSLAARRPARKLMDGGALGQGFGRAQPRRQLIEQENRWSAARLGFGFLTLPRLRKVGGSPRL
jgi:hypothetical protein